MMMSLRKNDHNSYSGTSTYTCSLLSREPLQNYLAAEWVVEKLNNANNGTGYVPGVKIGFYGMDDCRSAVYSSRNALSFLDVWVPSTIETCTQSEPEVLHIGLIGPSRSSTATRVASLLRDVQVPIISMSATSTELSNSVDYPTFFRTVPSDEHQMNMIVQILEQMSWTFVAVVHSNDDYGSSAALKLAELAAQKKICIHKSFSLGSDSVKFNADLLSLIKEAKGFSIAIPFIGSRDDAEQFLLTLNKLARVDNRDIRYGFHLILSESANTDVTIYKGKDIGVGTISVGGSNIFLDDLYKDLMDKVTGVTNGENHRLIEQYNTENRNGIPLITPGILDAFVPLTVHAVFALAEALRVEHQNACGGKPGVCDNLRTNVEKGSMLSRVQKVYVDYQSMDAGVPPENFRKNNYTVSFNENGDIKLVNKNTLYSIYQYRDNGQYEQIGNYIDGQAILEMDKMKFLTPSGSPSPASATSVCSTNCADCFSNSIPTIFLEGDVYILGVFSIHETSNENPVKCGGFRSVGNDVVAAEGFLFAVNELRRITNINFGAIAIDDCYSPLRVTSILSYYFSDLVNSNISFPVPRDKLVGVVACRSSGCTISAAHFFMPINIPVVSYASTSPDLDSKIDFPYFLRTVPSDVFQAEVMLNITKALNWEYVGILYVKNNYGAKGMKEFKNFAMKDNSVCIAVELEIGEIESSSDASDFRKIYEEFVNLNIKVVVFFGIDNRFRSFLSFLERGQYYGKFIFIGSEDWGVNRDIYKSGPKSARGSLTLKIQDIQLDSYTQFRDHLSSKSPALNDTNIWFTEFWQNEFSCNLKGAFINTFEKECGPDQKLSKEQLDTKSKEQRVTQVMNAVYALGKGIADVKNAMCSDVFPCNYYRQNTKTVVESIRKQTRQQGGITYNIFDNNGNGALGYDVYNIQQQTADGNPYVKVGSFKSNSNASWDPIVFLKDKLKFYDAGTFDFPVLISTCSESLCARCQPRKQPDVDAAKESSSSLSEYRQSDVLLISLIAVLILAVLVAIAAVAVFFTRKYRSLKKQIQNCKEEIYDEPDKILYQPYSDTHGISFANSMNPYPIINSIRLNNSESSASDLNGGVNNLAFISDNIESVSQVGAVVNRNQSGRSINQNQARNAPSSVISTGQFVSPYSSRPLPVSPIGNDSFYRSKQGSQNYVENRTDNTRITRRPSSSIAGSMSGNVNMSRTPESQSLAGGQIFFVASPSMRGKPAGGSEIQDQVVYFMQGSNGQLAPQNSSSPEERDAFMQDRQHLQKRASVKSHTSSANSSVNPSYGPYSTAALQRAQMLQHQQQQLQFSNSIIQTSPLAYRSSPVVNDNINSYNGNTSVASVKSTRPNENHAFAYQEIESSPIHYASPSKNSQDPVSNIPASHYQSPTSNINQQHPILPSPMFSRMNQFAAITNYNYVDTEDNVQHSEQSLQEVDEPHHSPERSPDHSPHSMISSSIPDVVEQTSMPADYQRQASLESINLSSSKESLDEIDVNVKNTDTKKNGNAVLRALSALSGNISKV